MQRPVGFPRATDENCVINITPHSPQSRYSPRGSVDDTDGGGGFLINNDAQHSGNIIHHHHHHRKRSRFRQIREKWVLIVSLTILLLFLLVFWWVSFPVKLVIRDGRLTAINWNGMQLPLETRRRL